MSKFSGVNSLDYVCAWIWKAVQFGEMVQSSAVFVATSSICQGQSVSLLWAQILYDVENIFAHQSFKWKNNAKKNTAVTCIIVGFGRQPIKERTIYYVEVSRYKINTNN